MIGEVIQVRPLSLSNEAAWVEYVGRHPDGTFFHELTWKTSVERAFSHRAHYLLALRGVDVVGVLPMFLIDSAIAGRMLVSQPYATYGGLLANDDAAAAVLLAEAQSLMRRCGARVLELRSVSAADSQAPIRRSHATFIRELPSRADEVVELLPRKARAAARKAAQQHAVTVEFGDHLLDEAWRLYARSMRRLGSPNYPLRFFRSIAAAAPGRCVSQIVRCQGRAVAGLVSFLHRRTAMPYFVGFDERAAIYGLSQYLYMESMKRAVEMGCEVYDFGRSRLDNAGACVFKKLCGFAPRVLEYQDFVGENRTLPDLAPTSARWQAARSVWRRLPLGMTRPLGSWLARSIPG